MEKTTTPLFLTPHKCLQEIVPEELQTLLLDLHAEFETRRQMLLSKREERQKQIDSGSALEFLSGTAAVREDNKWKVAKIPPDLEKRWVEITGPTDRKMVINALNSGADVYMADFEDATSPTWENILQGQINLRDAILGTITYSTPEGKEYRLGKETAVLFVRPRGWHLFEKHVLIEKTPISASLFDAAVYFYHNTHELLKKGKRPYFYLPKLESHQEARLWNDVFLFLQKRFKIPVGTIRATVLIETLFAAFEMEEILYELREHCTGLNAGRWDYIFSIIKTYQKRELILPDRDLITMTVPFMRAYTELLVRTCHKRGAHALGGMAAFIPNKKDIEATELALQKVQEDKDREASDGFDGTWVAHPDLVPIAKEAFEKYIGEKKHQKERLKEDVVVTEELLTNFTIEYGVITEKGVRHNTSVALQYMANWLLGKGAVSLFNLMEDAATAEISRAQLWQWHKNLACTKEGNKVTAEFLRVIFDEEMQKIRRMYGEHYPEEAFALALSLLKKVVMGKEIAPFLTLIAYEYLE